MNRDDDIGDEHTVDDNFEVSSASSSDDEGLYITLAFIQRYFS